MEGSAPIQSQDRQSHPRVQVMQSENCGTGTSYGQWREATPPLIRCGGGGGLGPGDTFGDTLAENTPESIRIGLVGGAYGGAKIEYFLPNCQQYGECSPPYGAISGAPNGGTGGYDWVLDLAKKAQQVGVIKGFIFHQGESNSGQNTWLPRVNEYITALRNDLGLSPAESPFIAGELPYTGCCSGHNSLVRQIPEYVENGHWVPADGGLGDKGDALHWDSAAVREMGRRYANKMLELVDVSGEPLDCGTSPEGNPICCNISADPNGDGWGEQNDGEMCVVTPETNGYIPPNPDDVAVAINVGSTQGASFDDIYYEADRDFSDGTMNRTGDSVSGANGSDVYSTERYGEFTYEIPIRNQRVSVELGFVEMYQTATGSRAFNVSIEGQQVLSNVDIFSEVGHDAVYRPAAFEVEVNDNSLTIDVSTITDNGTLSAILVRTTSGGGQSSSASSSSSAPSSNPPASSSSANSSSGSGSAGGGFGWLMLMLMSSLFAVRKVRFVRR